MKARLYLLFLLLFSLTWSFSDAQVRRVIQNPPAKTTEKPVKEEFDENEEESTGLDDENDEEDPDSVTVIPDDFTSSLDFLLENWAVDKNVTTNCKSEANPSTEEYQYRE